MIIREYIATDEKQINNLIAELQDYEAQFVAGMLPGQEMSEQYLKQAILKDVAQKDGALFVAEDNEIIAGFVWVYKEVEPRDLRYKNPTYTSLCIGDLIVSKNYRGKGVGKALFERVEKYSRDKGINKIKLHVNAQNDLARKFYEEIGLSEEEIIMVKDLT